MKTKFLRTGLVALLLMSVATLSWAQSSTTGGSDTGYLQGGSDHARQAPPTLRNADGAYLQQDARGGYLPTGGGDGYLGGAQTKGAGSLDTDGFVAAPAGSTEQINGGRLMLIAYAGFWLLALAYIASLAGRARTASKEATELRRQLQELEDRLEDLEAGRS